MGIRRAFAAIALTVAVAGATAGGAAAEDSLLENVLDGGASQLVGVAESAVAPASEPVAEVAQEVVVPAIGVVPQGEPVAPAVEDVEQATAPVVEPIEQPVAPVREAVDETVAPLLETVEPVIPAVTEPPIASAGPETKTGATLTGQGRPQPNEAPSLHGSLEVPLTILASVASDPPASSQPSAAIPPRTSSGAELSSDSASPGGFSLAGVGATTSPAGAAPPSSSGVLDRVTAPLEALADRTAAAVASSGSWAAAALAIGLAAALAALALIVFPGLWFRIRAFSERAGPSAPISLLERPG